VKLPTNSKLKMFTIVAPIVVPLEQLFPDRNPFLHFLSSVLAPIVVPPAVRDA